MNATTGHAAVLSPDQENPGKFVATFKGEVIARSGNPNYIRDTIRRGLNQTAVSLGVTHVVELNEHTEAALLNQEVPMAPKFEFSIAERFDFTSDFVKMIIAGDANGVLIAGRGGLGKTHTVKKEFELAGLTYTHHFSPPVAEEKECDSEDGEDCEGEDDVALDWVNPGDIHYVKGYSSPVALYKMLWENNGKIIVFDDCDSIHKDTNAVNILKGALDTEDERWVAWHVGRRPNGCPMSFQFTGRIVFITNLKITQIDENLLTRCLKVDLSMTDNEKLERMEYIIHQADFLPSVEMAAKEEALEFIVENVQVINNLSMRALLDTIKLCNTNTANWKRKALYSLTA